MAKTIAWSLGLAWLAVVPAVHGREAVAPYRANVAELARDNDAFRRVLYTGVKSQVVAMSLKPGEDIGDETHAHVEQTFVVVSGKGRLSLNGVESSFGPGDVVVIPPGTAHDITNVGTTPLKLATIYVPPNHLDQRVQATKADAAADREDIRFGQELE